MVWGQHYLIIVLPSLCVVSGTGKLSISSVASFDSQFSLVFKVIDIYQLFTDGATDIRNPVLYAAFSLATTLWCTLLIIYRILSVGWENSGAGGGVRPYWHVIEILVESSALYSVCVIIYVICFTRNSWGSDYADMIAAIARV